MPNKHEELRKELLGAMKCIDSHCDQSGNIPYQTGEDEWEADQCQYCFEQRFPIVDLMLGKIDQIEKVSYKKGYEDGLKQGMFDEEMNKINTQLK